MLDSLFCLYIDKSISPTRLCACRGGTMHCLPPELHCWEHSRPTKHICWRCESRCYTASSCTGAVPLSPQPTLGGHLQPFLSTLRATQVSLPEGVLWRWGMLGQIWGGWILPGISSQEQSTTRERLELVDIWPSFLASCRDSSELRPAKSHSQRDWDPVAQQLPAH